MPRDDLGEPTEQAGQGSRRPLAEQILEEQRQEAVPGPLRDEQGRFAAREDEQAAALQRFSSSPTTEEAVPFEPDAAAEAPAVEEPQTEEERQLLAGRFQDPAELERAYLELEQQQGRSSGELGDLRGRVEELSRRLNEAPVAPQPIIQPALTPEQIDAGLDTAGVEFLAGLYEAGHPSYDATLDRLYEVAPRLAGDWQSRVAAWEAQQELRAEVTPALAAVAGPVSRTESQSRWNDEWRRLAAEHPEMNQLAEVMMKDLEANPHLTLPLKEGLPGAERMILENVLIRARDANRDKITAAAAKQDEEVGAEKIAAQVVRASAGAARIGGEGAAEAEAIRGLKARVLGVNSGSNIHEEIARSRAS